MWFSTKYNNFTYRVYILYIRSHIKLRASLSCACIFFANGFFNDSIIIFYIQIQIKFMISLFRFDMQIIIIINYASYWSNFYEYGCVYMAIKVHYVDVCNGCEIFPLSCIAIYYIENKKKKLFYKSFSTN